MNKKIILTFLTSILLLSVFMLVSCSDNSGNKMEPYDESKFTGSTNTESIKLDTDNFINIDGNLSEAEWEDKKIFSYNYGTVKVETKTLYGKLGFYVGITVKDPHVFASQVREVWKGSSIELYIDKGDSVKKTVTTFQYRISAINRVELLNGKESPEDNWTNTYLPIYGLTSVQGEVNSGVTEGMTAEIFMRWDCLGYDYTAEGFQPPESVKIAVAYNQASGAGADDEREAWCNNGGDYFNPEQYWQFGTDGFILEDAENAVIGDSLYGRAKTPYWNLSKEKEGMVTSTYGGEQSIFFRNFSKQDYVITAKISYKSAANSLNFPSGDPYPKAGITVASGNLIYSYLIDYSASGISSNSTKGMFFNRGNPDPCDLWTIFGENDLTGKTDNKYDIRITAVKKGESLLIFVGDNSVEKFGGEFVAMLEDSLLKGEATPGFYTMGSIASFSDYEVSTDETRINTILENNFATLSVQQKTGGALSDYNSLYPLNGTAKIKIETYEGYRLSSIKVNDEEKINTGDITDGVLSVDMITNITVIPEFTPISDNLYEVSGKIILGNILGNSVEIFIKNTSDNTMSYRTSPTNDGLWNINLSDGSYKGIIKTESGIKIPFFFIVNGSDMVINDIILENLFENDSGVTFNEDGYLTFAKQTTTFFNKSTTDEGFVLSYSVERTDGNFNQSGTWNTGGAAIRIGNTVFRIFIMSENGNPVIYFNCTTNWSTTEYRLGGAYTGTGAPIETAIVYYNETFYIMLDNEFVAVINANTPYSATKTEDIFSSQTRTIGLASVDTSVKFENYLLKTGNENAITALDQMKKTISVNNPQNGNVVLSDTKVFKGKSVTVTITPDTGYEVDQFTVNGEDKKSLLILDGNNLKYTQNNILEDLTVNVTFKLSDVKTKVLGSYSYATAIDGNGDIVTISSSQFSGTAGNGSFTIDLPEGTHTLTLDSQRFKSITTQVTISNGVAQIADTLEFSEIKFVNEKNLTYNQDSTVTVNAYNSFWDFAGISPADGFTVTYRGKRADGIFNENGTWNTGGFGIRVGAIVYRIYVMKEGDGIVVYLGIDGGATQEYRQGGTYAGTGAPITVTVAYYNGEIHLLLDGVTHYTLNAENTNDALDEIFTQGEKSIGFIQVGKSMIFGDISYKLGNDAAQLAISEM
jgi:hypothetical protein